MLFSHFCLVSLESGNVNYYVVFSPPPASLQNLTCECPKHSRAQSPFISRPALALLPSISQLSPSCAPGCFLGTLPGRWPRHHALLLPGSQKKDVLTAQPGLDCVPVSCWGSRTSRPPGFGARLESKALEVGWGALKCWPSRAAKK